VRRATGRRSEDSRKPRTIDEYLAPLDAEKRASLQKLRKSVRSAAPRAEECISYGIPAFRLDGRLLVAFGAGAKHCAFYPGARPIEAHREALRSYSTSKGTVRFPPANPLPGPLVRKLVKTRIAEYSRGSGASGHRIKDGSGLRRRS
jgi:uncharacterized protein YdhG (YjbR/CyaY superfamily)